MAPSSPVHGTPGGLATGFSDVYDAHAQNHDRMQETDVISALPTSLSRGLSQNPDIEITTLQKTLSAMSGSLLTSLIGTSFAYSHSFNIS